MEHRSSLRNRLDRNRCGRRADRHRAAGQHRGRAARLRRARPGRADRCRRRHRRCAADRADRRRGLGAGVVGNTVYAGGKFTNARPAGAAAGTNQTPRSNLLAYDITTGDLITTFAPSLNGQVHVGHRVARRHPALRRRRLHHRQRRQPATGSPRFNTATGALITTFAPTVDYAGQRASPRPTPPSTSAAPSPTPTASPASRLAAFNAANGALLGWNPTADADGQRAGRSTPGRHQGHRRRRVRERRTAQPAYGLAALDADHRRAAAVGRQPT